MLLLLALLPASLIASALHQPHPQSADQINHVDGPLTSHFVNWLKDFGFAGEDFSRLDYGDQGSYGGKYTDDEKVVNTPVVFIHGTSDAALAAGQYQGWTNTIQYFLDQGWHSSSLYATSWGDDNPSNATLRTHDCNTTRRLRRFIQAVKGYTEYGRLSVVAHSMGVTLARKAILGGKITASDGECDLGPPLRYIDVFVGLSGANWGLCNCLINRQQPDCNHDNGFWPGDYCGFNARDQCGAPKENAACTVLYYSKFLLDMNQDMSQLAKRVVSAWSTADNAIENGDEVWGQPTSLIPRTNTKKIYTNYTHMGTKESPEGVKDQYEWVNRII